MRSKILLALLLGCAVTSAAAQQEVRFWHAMGGALGVALDAIVQRFNASQREFHVVAEHKGSYEDTMIAALAAQRAGDGPRIVQVDEVGTEHMMAARHAIRPVWRVLAEAGEHVDAGAFLPAVASYFSDRAGRLIALPFNVATPILFYNKDEFRRAGLDPDRPPRTWYEFPRVIGALKDAGVPCGYTTTWPAWILVENMTTWHDQDFATQNNGMDGLDARLVFNTQLMMRHIAMLSSWARSGYFTYAGRRVEGEQLFVKGDCALLTAASSSAAELRRSARFGFGEAQLPYYDDIPGAPHHSLIGGGALWVLEGGTRAEARGAAKFLAFLARPEVQADWDEATGFVPVTRAAYALSRSRGFYATHPGQEIAIRQLLLHNPPRESRGIRLGEFRKIRLIIEEELEAVWNGTKPPLVALDEAARRGNVLLRAFEVAHKAGIEPGVPARVPRRPKKAVTGR